MFLFRVVRLWSIFLAFPLLLMAWQWKPPLPYIEDGTVTEESQAGIVCIAHLEPFSGQLRFVCSGILMAPGWVLTVAHGVDAYSPQELGVAVQKNGIAEPNSVLLIDSIVVPKSPDGGEGRPDLALLRIHKINPRVNACSDLITIRTPPPHARFKLLGWSAKGSNLTIRLTQCVLENDANLQGFSQPKDFWDLRPEKETWHIGPGNSGAPVFALDPTEETPYLVGMLIAAETEQRTLFQKNLRVRALAPWGPIIRQICAGNIPDGFECKSLQSANGVPVSDFAQGPNCILPLDTPGEWFFELRPENRLPARVPIYMRHYLLGAHPSKTWKLQVEGLDETEGDCEVSVWTTTGMRMLGRIQVANSKPLDFKTGDDPVLFRFEFMPHQALSGPVRFKASLHETPEE